MNGTNGTDGTNDCITYINKIAHFGTNYAPGQVLISAHASGYANTNYYFDDTRTVYQGPSGPGSDARSGVLSANPTASITYTNVTNDVGLIDHITNGLNVAGFLTWGYWSTLGMGYATNGEVKWSGPNNGWWIIRTVESFNGERDTADTGQGNFLMWFSAGAFGGTNYANTPVAAVCYTDEPYVYGTIDASYFGLWESGKSFAICAWNSLDISILNFYTQAVGDPFVTK